MAELLLILLVVMLVTAVVMLVGLALAARAVRKRNRVSPSVQTTAPTTWMGAPSAGARLHRRLRTAVAVARAATAAAPEAAHLADLTAELEREAVALDTHLVIAARLKGREGRLRMAALAQQVRKVEQVASQVSLLAAQAQAPMLARGQESALDDLARQLDLLEQARSEVAAVESAAGVHRVSPYASSTGASPARATSPGPTGARSTGADPTRVAPPDLGKPSPGQAVPGT